jgi:hypothetical protein
MPLEEGDGEEMMDGAFVMSPEGSEGAHTRQQSAYVPFSSLLQNKLMFL